VEKLDVQLAVFNVIPQRMSRIVLNAVVGLRSQIGQRWRQVARGAAPRLTRQIVGHRLQNGKVKTTRLPSAMPDSSASAALEKVKRLLTFRIRRQQPWKI
jgi:hypothetical protein